MTARSARALAAALALAIGVQALSIPPAAAVKKRAPHVTNTKREDRPLVSRGQVLMGTLLTIEAEAHDSVACGAAIERAMEGVARLDQVLSSWRDDAELARVNQGQGGVRIPCSREMAEAAAAALEIAEETEGAFDPTIEPLARAWDLRGTGREPTREELRDAIDRVGWRRVLVDRTVPSIRFQRDRMGLDFGGIGKGIALDQASRVLTAGTVRRALLNFGGEVLAFSDGPAWSVQVADPEDRERAVVNIVVRNGGVSTSGQSEHRIKVGWRSYGHIVDPQSGRPLDTVASVTVITASAARADGLSTGLLVMGRSRAEAFALEHGDLGVLWLERVHGELQGWRWNLPSASALAGSNVKWMN